VQVPAVSPLVPQSAVLGPVFIDSRPVAASPPSAAVSVPFVSPQHYADFSVMPHSVKFSPVTQPHVGTSSVHSTAPGIDSNAQSSPVVGDG